MPFEREQEVAAEAVERAGAAVMRHFRRECEVRMKSVGNPVTEADLEANEILRKALLDAFPSSRWLSEEGARREGGYDDGPTWVVDPLDGTADFVAGLAEFAVSVALVEGGRARVAAVCNPAEGDLWSAREGGGATRNGRPIRVRDARDLSSADILVSRAEHRRGDLAAFSARLRLRPKGSIAYKLCLVASGEGDAVFTRKPRRLWDICGGALVLSEAGGRVTDGLLRPIEFHPARIDVARIIGAAPGLFEALARMLSEPP